MPLTSHQFTTVLTELAIALAVAIAVIGWLVWQLRAVTRRAARDPLTQLAHRDTARAYYRQRTAAGQLTTLLILDLDRFKPINDNLGHTAGDQLIQSTATRLTRTITPWGGLVARLGGDEFAVLLAAASVAEHIRQIHLLRAAISEPVTVDGHHRQHTLTVSVTVGIAIADPDIARLGWEAMLRAADLALYHAKRTRRPYQIHHPDLEVPPRLHDLRLRDLPCAELGGDQS